MLGTLSQSFARLSVRYVPAAAGPSSLRLAGNAQHGMPLCQPMLLQQQVRHRGTGQMAPRKTKYRKAHKGRVMLHTGGSIRGSSLSEEAAYGLRLLAPTRLSAKLIHSCETAVRRKLKTVKGAQIYTRVFPDIPVCVKGNETRMGKGKGGFDHWGCRASVGRVIFEVGGPVEIRPEVAREALRLASAKLPVKTEFIDRQSPPRLGLSLLSDLTPGTIRNPSIGAAKSVPATPAVAASTAPSATPTLSQPVAQDGTTPSAEQFPPRV